jgi:hypothetical protein
MVKLKIYVKQGCWLCDAGEDMINGYREKYDIRAQRIEIDTDEELHELYRFDVPVMEFTDGFTLNGHIKKKHFIKALEDHTE